MNRSDQSFPGVVSRRLRVSWSTAFLLFSDEVITAELNIQRAAFLF